MSQCDLYMRLGDRSGRHPEDLSALPGIASLETYPSDCPFSELVPRILGGEAPFVVFVDSTFELKREHWTALIDSAAQAPDCAHTPRHEALNWVFGDVVNGGRLMDSLPSWFSLIPRSLLRAERLRDLPYETLEFALFELSGDATVQLDSLDRPLEPFNLEEWVGDLFFDRIADFSRDYRRYRERHDDPAPARVPPQFRVETRHREINFSVPEFDADSTDHPRFSIICPVFKPDFIGEMIESISLQSWPHWELLLGVDGPPAEDEARILETIANNADSRIRHFVQENRGTGPTRQRLAEMARGDFVLYIDDDDMLVPQALEVFAAAVKAFPEGEVFRGGSRLVGLLERELPPNPRYLIDGISNDPFEVTHPHVIRRDTLKSLGGYQWDTSLHNAGEDTYLFHRIDQSGIPVNLIRAPLYLRRLSTKNLSLQFTYDEAMAHFANLDQRFCPPGWKNEGRIFQMEENFQRALTTYVDPEHATKVVTATRFFQYQTFGDLSKVTIDLEVTAKCNAVCGFCPREVMPKEKAHIELDTVRALAGNLRQTPGALVVLCGIGESTMHPELEEIVNILRGAGATVAMTSNGSRMDEETFEKLVAAGLSSFNFSLNGNSAETHQAVMGMKNYDRVMENVERVLEIRNDRYPHIQIHVSFVVCNLNHLEVPDFVERWRPRKVSEIWLHPVNNRAGLLGASLKSVNLETYAERYAGDDLVTVDIFKDHFENDNLCKIARSLAFISSDGEMRLCAMDYRRITSMGNLNRKSVQQMHFEKLLGYVRGEYDEFCQGCDFCPQGIAAAETKTELEAV